MKISVIGAGLGGMAAGAILASKGHEVHLFERTSGYGGKMNEIHIDGFRFDTGPSLFTMPNLLKQVFDTCGENLEDHLSYEALDPLCRYFYTDGTVFNNYSDRQQDLAEIKRIAPEDLQAYEAFLKYSEGLYEKTADAFLFNPLYSLSDLKDLNLFSFLGIDAFSTVSDKVDEFFDSVYLRKFFKRFTTYNGSSPYKAPATLNVIPHVEVNQGGYYVKGGLYQIARSLHDLCVRKGVKLHFNSDVDEICVEDKRTTGIKINDQFIKSDLVISNSDSTETLTELVGNNVIRPSKKERIRSIEPSCSGFVLLLGIDRQYDQLAHHNIFFSRSYDTEFRQIFKEQVMPDDPTIYIANTSYSDKEHAPKGSSNLFVLINAPYLSDNYDWDIHKNTYHKKIINLLEEKGLTNLSDHIVISHTITPIEFYKKYRSNKGSIYGTSSNNLNSAFIRPRNKYRGIKGLYLCGGSTHPGGGIPLVLQSAFNAVELIERYEAP